MPLLKKDSRNATVKKPPTNQPKTQAQPKLSNAGFNKAFGISGFAEVQSLLEISLPGLLGVCCAYQILYLRYSASPNSNCRQRNTYRGNEITAKKLSN